MTNPSNAIGTNGAYGGRTSVNAFNDVLGAFSRGVLSGWECVPNSGLTVSLGGNGTTRDVAIAEDNAGNRTTIDNISGSPVDVTMSAAPAANSRIDAIVAYVDNPPTGTSTVADNPAACGIIAVDGIAAGSPVAPDDNAIRTAITADGASGSTAYYVVLATITIATGTTDIVAGDIAGGATAFSGLKKWVPDYSQMESTNLWSSGNTATMTEDGFVACSASVYKSNANVTVEILVNGSVISKSAGEARNPNNAVMAPIWGLIPVTAGDVVSIDPNGASYNYKTCYFIPGKLV